MGALKSKPAGELRRGDLLHNEQDDRLVVVFKVEPKKVNVVIHYRVGITALKKMTLRKDAEVKLLPVEK